MGDERCRDHRAGAGPIFDDDRLPKPLADALGRKSGDQVIRTWTEEQSRLNFEMVAKLVNPGDPESSLLTQHPLAPEAGGHAFHSGGRQFKSKDDEDWKTLAAFVNGAKTP
jgi:hypothetical protein